MQPPDPRPPTAAPPPPEPGPAADAEGPHGLAALALLSLLAGVGVGLVGAAFRLALLQADHLREVLIAWAGGVGPAGFSLVVATPAAAAAVAAWLVRRFASQASGSGIPHVEAVLTRDLVPQPAWRLIGVKFVGGVLAIGSGLALGREGPSVQMGSSVSHLVGTLFRRSWADCRALFAAGAGAGLATAFNAPLAGSVFVLEELVKRFETRLAVAALGTSATAIAVARLFLGDAPDFRVAPLAFPCAGTTIPFFMLGALAGLLAVAYNGTLLGALGAAELLHRWPVELRAALVGIVVGVIAWFAPDLVGGGDPITQRTLAGAVPLTLLPLVCLLRFGLGPLSYAAQTPGGLFAPLLVVGAQAGLLFGILCRLAFPDLNIEPEAFAVVGMAAFFTGVVRAPVTGILLVIEMTASFRMFLPMLGACFAAMLVAMLLRNPPIYDSLRERLLRRRREATPAHPAER
jgi:CIC family chloride channel protein